MRELRLALRERMFYVRLRTMTKNRVVTVFDRYPEQTAQLKKLGDLFGKTGRQQLVGLKVSEIDRIQIDRGLEFIGDINERIKQSEATIRAMTKTNGNVKLLKTIPGIGEFFARLIDAEIDDISRFRNPKKLAAYAGLVPSTYSSGGKTYHGKIIRQGNKWLRWAFVEAVQPAIATDPQLRAQYEHLKFRGVNKARVAIARKLLAITFQILLDSGDKSLLVWGDIVHFPQIQVPRPDVSIAFDQDAHLAADTRSRLLDCVAAEQLLIAGMHLGESGFARIKRAGDNHAVAYEE